MSETEDFIPDGTKGIIIGAPLLEVVSVTITRLSYSCELHGKILVVDGSGAVRIFNVGPEKSISINSPGQKLPLLNRNRAIIASDDYELSVYFDLKDKDGDAEFVNGSCSLSGEQHNKLLVEEIKGELGSVSVSYYVHWAAVEANIWATLDQKSLPRDLDANLKVVAGYEYVRQYDMEHLIYERCNFTMFDENLKNLRHDDEERDMPLHGCVLALPPYSGVTIEICLKSCEDDEVLWSTNCVMRIQRCGKVIELGVGCPAFRPPADRQHLIKLYAIAHDYHVSQMLSVRLSKNMYCPKWLFEVFKEDEVWEDEEEEVEEEDRKRKMSQPQAQSERIP